MAQNDTHLMHTQKRDHQFYNFSEHDPYTLPIILPNLTCWTTYFTIFVGFFSKPNRSVIKFYNRMLKCVFNYI